MTNGLTHEIEQSTPRSSRVSTYWMLGAAVVLLVLHIVLAVVWPYFLRIGEGTDGPAPPPLRATAHVALYIANLFVVASIVFGRRGLSVLRVGLYVLGYLIVVGLLWPLILRLPQNILLLVLALLMYGGMLHHPWTLGYLFLFLLCQRFFSGYLYPAFLLSSLLYTTLGPSTRAVINRRERFIPLCHVAGLILLMGLLLPIIYFCTQSTSQEITQRLRETEVLAALGTSLRTSALASFVVLLLGVPMAYAMVRRSFPGRGLIDTLIDLPIVVPPPIAGIALLAFFGPKAPMGKFMAYFNVSFFDSVWGIVAAQIFVGSPYLIRASMVAFSSVDERYENVARTLGSSNISVFARITLPLSLRGILIGVILTWFRAMAEFGSLRILANNPKTIPILTWDKFNDFSVTESESVSVVILLLCLGVIIGMWIIRSMPNILGKSIGAADAAS